MSVLVSCLTPGKIRRLRRLADADGRFAMLAVDQRRSRFQMIAARAGRAEAAGAPDEATAIKGTVTTAVSPYATAVLADPLFGCPQTEPAISADCGVIVAGEVTGYGGFPDRRAAPDPDTETYAVA